jgi:hypothetical protein
MDMYIVDLSNFNKSHRLSGAAEISSITTIVLANHRTETQDQLENQRIGKDG